MRPDYINSLLKDPISEFTVLTHITVALGENFVQDWQSCVIWAVRKFTEHFDHQIKQLLHKYPANHLSAEGQKFWSGPKRAPTPIEFNVNGNGIFFYNAPKVTKFCSKKKKQKVKKYFREKFGKKNIFDFFPHKNFLA